MKFLLLLLIAPLLAHSADWNSSGPTKNQVNFSCSSQPGIWTVYDYSTNGKSVLKITEDYGKTFGNLADKFGSGPVVPTQILPFGKDSYLFNSYEGLSIASNKKFTLLLSQQIQILLADPEKYIVGTTKEGNLVVNQSLGKFDRWELINIGTKIFQALPLSSDRLAIKTEKGIGIFSLADKKVDFVNKGLDNLSFIALNLFVIEGQLFAYNFTGDFYRLKDAQWEALKIKKKLMFEPQIQNYAKVHKSQEEDSWFRIVLENNQLMLKELGNIPTRQINLGTSYEQDGILHLGFMDGTIFFESKPVNLKILMEGKSSIKITTKANNQDKTFKIKNAEETEQEFSMGQVVELEAIPEAGMRFVGWFDANKKELSKELKFSAKITTKELVLRAVFEKQ